MAALSTLSCNTFTRAKHVMHYYAFGNSVAQNLLLRTEIGGDEKMQIASEKDDVTCILSLGCGDLRHVLHTLDQRNSLITNAAAPKAKPSPSNAKSPSKEKHLKFVLNDWQPKVIARNALMCFAMSPHSASLGLPSPTQLAQLWYSILMDKPTHAYWMDMLKRALDRISELDPSSASASSALPFSFCDTQTFHRVKAIWLQWLYCDWTKATLVQQRTEYLNAQPNLRNKDTDVHTNHICMQQYEGKASLAQKKEITLNIKTGIFPPGKEAQMHHINPTMLLCEANGQFIYSLHYGTFLWEGHWLDANSGPTTCVLAALKRWIAAFSLLSSSPQSLIKLEFGMGHVLTFMEDAITRPLRFDVIDTSNLADHVGMANLCMFGSALLKHPFKSVLYTSTFLSYSFAVSRADYLDQVLGVPSDCYAVVYGLNLEEADTRDWKSQVQPFAWKLMHISSVASSDYRTLESFTWFKAPTPSVPVSLDDSPYLCDVLCDAAKAMSVSCYVKNGSPGKINANGATIAKLLALAFTQGRVCASGAKAVKAVPLPAPIGLLQKLMDCEALKTTIAEIFTYLNLYGFDLRSRSEWGYFVGQPVHSTIRFPRFSVDGTPMYHIFLYTEIPFLGCQQFEALQIVEESRHLVVSLYLPPFVNTLKPENVEIALFSRQVFVGGMCLNFPYGLPLNLSETYKHVKVDQYAARPVLKGMLKAMPSLAKPDSPRGLPVESVVKVQHGYQIRLEIGEKHKTAKFQLNESNCLPCDASIMVDGDCQNISFCGPVDVKSVKIHRKSGFIALDLVHQRANIDFYPYYHLQGMVFDCRSDEAENQVILSVGLQKIRDTYAISGNSLSHRRSHPMLTEMRTNMITLMNLYMKYDAHMIPIHSRSLGIFGLVFVHGLYRFAPPDSTKAWSFGLLASYAFFSVRDIPKIRTILESLACKPTQQNLMVGDDEVPEIKALFALYARAFPRSTSPPRLPPIVRKQKLEHLFKPCVIHGLYDMAGEERLKAVDTTKQDKERKVGDLMRQMMGNFMGGMPSMMREFQNL